MDYVKNMGEYNNKYNPYSLVTIFKGSFFGGGPLLFVGCIPLGVNHITFGFLPSAWVGDFLLKVKSFEWIVVWHIAH